MAVSTGTYLKGVFAQVKSLGDKAISSDGMLVIAGYEQMRLLCKQFPHPTLSTGGEIEVPGPMGMASFQQQQVKVHQQGQIAFYETVAGDIRTLQQSLLASGGKFDAIIYEGTMENYKAGYPVYDAFFQFDNPDRDWENRSQPLMFNGTMFFHYFGEVITGNS